MFDPPLNPANAEEYKYGNVTWVYQHPPGVWNIKDGQLVGQNGRGVTAFQIVNGELLYQYVYPDGTTSGNINLGSVQGAGAADPGITFIGFGPARATDRVVLGESISLTAPSVTVGGVASPIIRTAITDNTIRFDVRIASDSVTGVASFNGSQFDVSGAGVVSIDPNLAIVSVGSGSKSESLNISESLDITGDVVTGVQAKLDRLDASNLRTTIRGITASSTQMGTAKFRAYDFSVKQSDGEVSLTSGIVYSINGLKGVVSLPLANSTGTTGLATFFDSHFSVGTTGVVQSKGIQVQDQSSTKYSTNLGEIVTIKGDESGSVNGIITTDVSQAGNETTVTITPQIATNSLKGSASFKSPDFIVTSGVVSLTAGVINSINGGTGNQLVGAGDDKVVFTNPTGITTSGNFLFNGSTLTFGGINTEMVVTGPTFTFGDLTTVKGGVYTLFSEQATAYNETVSSNQLVIDPRDGTIQKIKMSGVGGRITVKADTVGWSAVPNTVQSVVVYAQQVGTGWTGNFETSVLSDRNAIMFGVTGGIDVFTICRYAVDATKGLTTGYSIAAGLTATGVAF